MARLRTFALLIPLTPTLVREKPPLTRVRMTSTFTPVGVMISDLIYFELICIRNVVHVSKLTFGNNPGRSVIGRYRPEFNRTLGIVCFIDEINNIIKKKIVISNWSNFYPPLSFGRGVERHATIGQIDRSSNIGPATRSLRSKITFKKPICLAFYQALEFAEDPPLTDELARLWAAVRKVGEQSIKWDGGDECSRTRVVDNCRRLMPEIKRAIVTVQKTMEKLDEVRAHRS